MRNTLFHSFSKETFIAIFLAVIALISLSLFFFPATSQRTIKKEVSEKKVLLTPTKKSEKKIDNTVISSTPTLVETTPEQTQTQTIQITIVVTPTPTKAIQSNKNSISVSIDGVSPFSIDLDSGKNQCDVLSQALSDKKIAQLLMKYDSSLDSYGVYQINNVGKENAVWWTYTVNGKSPNAGCNHIAANNGDSVSWQYIGN